MNDRPHNGSPKLPKMSPQERELWMVSHRAPDGMLMIHREEVAQIAGAARAAGGIVDTIFAMLQPVKQPGEGPMDTISRMLRDLGRLTIERDAYKFQCSEEQLAAAAEEIKTKLTKKP